MTDTTLFQEFDEVKNSRRLFDSIWEDVLSLVRINTKSFLAAKTSGEDKAKDLYDATAVRAAEQLASGLHSYLTSPSERWFGLGLIGRDQLEYTEAELRWLELAADTIFEAYSYEQSGFNASLHECYLDLACFGTCILYQSMNQGLLSFKSFPVADCWFRENSMGLIDTVWRQQLMTGRQVRQEFKDIPPALSKSLEESDENRVFTIIHCVRPRTDEVVEVKKPFASVWLCEDTKEQIGDVGGYDSMPYHVGRWIKLAGETYGRGPAMTCLPDIKVLNEMERLMLKAGNKAIDPPLIVPDEGYMLPLKTSPASLIYRETDAPDIVPLEHRGNLPFGLEQADRKRLQIQQAFYADWLRMEKQNKEMTAYEVEDRRMEKLQLMAPMLGRIQSELLGGLIKRTYQLLVGAGLMPRAPITMSGAQATVTYISPAARAQLAIKANDMSRFVQETAILAQIDPTVLDVFDLDQLVTKMAEYRGISRTFIRTNEARVRIREERAAQQAMQQAMEVSEPLTRSVKNLADARKAGIDTGALGAFSA